MRNTMSHFSSPKSDIPEKPLCLPGFSHHWVLETAQAAAGDGRVGTSDGTCVYCSEQYTFFNSIVDYDPRAYQQLYLGRLK
jgi:hypothetical protein